MTLVLLVKLLLRCRVSTIAHKMLPDQTGKRLSDNPSEGFLGVS
jgi:hypothetical protein